jgi:putative nucleotidyltransferase with HDIG domain
MYKETVIHRIYAKIDEIPTLSPLLQKIMGAVENSNSDARDLTDIISRDPSLTSKILKVANSAYYGFSNQVDNLDRAVMLLGFNMVRSLAMSAGIIRNLPSQNKSPRFSTERLWIHSLAVATIMKEMGMRWGRHEDSESLFIAGLLHDIGKVVLDQFFSEDYQRALEETGCLESTTVCEAEERYFGMNHGEVGSILLRRWKFPETICGIVSMDHKTEIKEGIDPAEVAMLHVADNLSKEAGMGVSESITPGGVHQAYLDTLGVTGSDMDDLREYLENAREGIYAFYESID